MLKVDASNIMGNLWQGSAPISGASLLEQGFETLVFCAEEYQPSAKHYPGIAVHYAPNEDDPDIGLTRDQLEIAIRASHQVVEWLNEDKKVLVTCMMGLNRSGLVVGLALHLWKGLPGKDCVTLVKKQRMGALFNRRFVEYLSKLPGKL